MNANNTENATTRSEVANRVMPVRGLRRALRSQRQLELAASQGSAQGRNIAARLARSRAPRPTTSLFRLLAAVA